MVVKCAKNKLNTMLLEPQDVSASLLPGPIWNHSSSRQLPINLSEYNIHHPGRRFPSSASLRSGRISSPLLPQIRSSSGNLSEHNVHHPGASYPVICQPRARANLEPTTPPDPLSRNGPTSQSRSQPVSIESNSHAPAQLRLAMHEQIEIEIKTDFPLQGGRTSRTSSRNL